MRLWKLKSACAAVQANQSWLTNRVAPMMRWSSLIQSPESGTALTRLSLRFSGPADLAFEAVGQLAPSFRLDPARTARAVVPHPRAAFDGVGGTSIQQGQVLLSPLRVSRFTLQQRQADQRERALGASSAAIHVVTTRTSAVRSMSSSNALRSHGVWESGRAG